jgi:CheY-like chemotaxis protein
MKILLVEDNELNRDMLSRRLIKKGFTVLSAVNGKEGIDKSITERPDLILMDLSLPIINGWDATREIKSNQETSAIPIIALTAHAMAEDRKKALDAGCDEYDTKPIEFDGLLDKINRLILDD